MRVLRPVAMATATTRKGTTVRKGAVEIKPGNSDRVLWIPGTEAPAWLDGRHVHGIAQPPLDLNFGIKTIHSALRSPRPYDTSEG